MISNFQENKKIIYEFVEIAQRELPFRSGENPQFNNWYQKIYDHLKNNLTPIIKENNENIIFYSPNKMAWGIEKRQQKNANGRFYLAIYGNYATGYLCLTSKRLYMVTDKSLSDQYPMFEKGLNNFFGDILGALSANTTNNRTRYLKDTIFYVQHSDIHSVSILPDEDYHQINELVFKTPATIWYCRSQFIDDDSLMATGIKMGMSNELAKIYQEEDEIKNKDKVFNQKALLEKLKDLYDADLITDEEYKTKKEEILKRL